MNLPPGYLSLAKYSIKSDERWKLAYCKHANKRISAQRFKLNCTKTMSLLHHLHHTGTEFTAFAPLVAKVTPKMFFLRSVVFFQRANRIALSQGCQRGEHQYYSCICTSQCRFWIQQGNCGEDETGSINVQTQCLLDSKSLHFTSQCLLMHHMTEEHRWTRSCFKGCLVVGSAVPGRKEQGLIRQSVQREMLCTSIDVAVCSHHLPPQWICVDVIMWHGFCRFALHSCLRCFYVFSRRFASVVSASLSCTHCEAAESGSLEDDSSVAHITVAWPYLGCPEIFFFFFHFSVLVLLERNRQYREKTLQAFLLSLFFPRLCFFP